MEPILILFLSLTGILGIAVVLWLLVTIGVGILSSEEDKSANA